MLHPFHSHSLKTFTLFCGAVNGPKLNRTECFRTKQELVISCNTWSICLMPGAKEWRKKGGMSWWKFHSLEVQNKSVSGNSAHLLSLPSTLCCGTAEYKVSNNFISSYWKKNLNARLSKYKSESENGVSPTQTSPSFHAKRWWKYYSWIIICLLNLEIWGRGEILVLMPEQHSCCIAQCSSNNTNCWGLKLVLCLHLALPISS